MCSRSDNTQMRREVANTSAADGIEALVLIWSMVQYSNRIENWSEVYRIDVNCNGISFISYGFPGKELPA